MSKKPVKRSSEPTKADLEKKVFRLMELINTEGISCAGYRSLDNDPTIVAGCEVIAGLVGLISWHLMANKESGGDVRIKNELSRKIDINPNSFMTRQHFYEAIAMNLILYGDGNCVVRPHTDNGYLRDLEVIPAHRVSFQADPSGYGYWIYIDGQQYDPHDLIHFALTPDKNYPWKGTGFRVAIKDVANNLKQAAATEKAFNSEKWKPPLIVKVDGISAEFADKGGRTKLVKDYLETSEAGEPWIIPAQQMEVQSVKPLTLKDLAISDTVQLNKKTVASILGVPSYFVGIGEFKKEEFNNFVVTRLRKIVECIQQTMTKSLILKPEWYIKGNIWQLLDWDLATITAVFTAFGDRGWITGNEARDRINMEPKDGLDELKVLENYIPAAKSGDQKKLIQEE
jgi:HK97 family phage portal protein